MPARCAVPRSSVETRARPTPPSAEPTETGIAPAWIIAASPPAALRRRRSTSAVAGAGQLTAGAAVMFAEADGSAAAGGDTWSWPGTEGTALALGSSCMSSPGQPGRNRSDAMDSDATNVAAGLARADPASSRRRLSVAVMVSPRPRPPIRPAA
jgi:hypothetical protein